MQQMLANRDENESIILYYLIALKSPFILLAFFGELMFSYT